MSNDRVRVQWWQAVRNNLAQLIPGINYSQLKKVNDWQMNEDAQRAALANPMNAVADLDTSLYWTKKNVCQRRSTIRHVEKGATENLQCPLQ